MRTRLKTLAATLGALLLLSGTGYDLLLFRQGVHEPQPTPEPFSEIVPPWACPKEGALLRLRNYNVITATFYKALNARFTDPSARGSELNFRKTMIDILKYDGRLTDVFQLEDEGELPSGYFNSVLEQKRLNALMDVMRPCPTNPILPGSSTDESDLQPQTGARLSPRLPDDQPGPSISLPYIIPVVFP